jgi:Spy/CpxP family protein refolding chaperone
MRGTGCRVALAMVLGTGLALGHTMTSANVAHADGRRHRPPGELVSRHAERLGLDADTQAALERILEESGARYQELKDEKGAAREELGALLSEPEPDRKAILAQAEVVDAPRSRATRHKLEAILRIHELLTPEQRAALVAIRAEERPSKRRRGPLGRCSEDLLAICGDEPDGPASLRCLADHWDALSDSCREAVRDRGDESNESGNPSESSEPAAPPPS